MEKLPHQYTVKSKGNISGSLIVYTENLSDITVAPPQQFGGEGDKWSPEDLFMASMTSCLVLSFRAIARASKLGWNSIECESVGELDKVERKLQFTHIQSKVKLHISKTENKDKALKLLHKADEACLISNSIACEKSIDCEVIVEGE